MKHKILIIECVLAAISFSACESGDKYISDNEQVNSYEKSDSKKVVAYELEKNKDDNKGNGSNTINGGI